MTLRACLRLCLLAAMLLAPIGRIGLAQAMTSPANASAAIAGHCADMPMAAPTRHGTGHHRDAPARDGERVAIDCMIACAAMTGSPVAAIAPPPPAMTVRALPVLSSLSGIQPEADPPPPRRS